MVSRLRFYRFWLRGLAYSLPLWAFSIAMLLRFHSGLFSNRSQRYDLRDYANLLLLTTLFWCWSADRYKISSVENLFWERTGIRAALSTCLATLVLESVTLFFLTDPGAISRIFVALSVVALFALTLILRFAFRRVVGYEQKEGKPLRVMLIGADEFASRVSKRLASTRLTNCRTVAYVRIPGQEVMVKGPRIYELDQVDAIDVSQIDDIIIAVPLSRFTEVSGRVADLQRLCKPIRAVMDFGNRVALTEKLFQFGNLQMMDVVTSPAETVEYLVLKRVFDVVFSLVVLIISSPVLAIIALAIKLSSPGPIFFRQKRVGLNGKIFTMHKFRTMRVASAAEADTRWTTENDPRRFAIGTFLRKTSLDEFPQFLDVLRGVMSVVGPRPERPYFVRKFLDDMDKYNERHRLKAGITGWAQVNGWRGDTSIEKRIEFDLYYLQNWSLAFDLRIVAQTIWSGVVNKNAY